MYDLGLKETFFKLREVRGGQKFILKHYFRLPTEEDWTKYHLSRNYMGLSKGRDTFEFANVMQEQDMDFWDSLILRVEGYFYADADLMTLDDWKEKIPTDHKLTSIGGFLIFTREELPESELIAGAGFDLASGKVGEESELIFQAVQDGVQKKLTFHFSRPETEDYVKFNRVASKMQIIRTKVRNVSELRVPADIKPFIKLFDKLVTKIDGYSFGGKDLMKVDKWTSKVDAYHKREVVRELFTASSLEEEEGN